MKDEQKWECTKCGRTYVPALPATEVLRQCECGNKRPMRLVADPPSKVKDEVTSSKNKEKK